MSSPVGHTLVGIAAGSIITGQWPPRAAVVIFVVFFSNVADIDHALYYFFGLERHTFTHSVWFIVFIYIFFHLIFSIFPQIRSYIDLNIKTMIILIPCVLSLHLGIDFFTEDNSYPFGIQLFYPLTDEFFIAPVTPLPATLICYPSLTMILYNLKTFIIETIVFLPPILIIRYYISRKNKK